MGVGMKSVESRNEEDSPLLRRSDNSPAFSDEKKVQRPTGIAVLVVTVSFFVATFVPMLFLPPLPRNPNVSMFDVGWVLLMWTSPILNLLIFRKRFWPELNLFHLVRVYIAGTVLAHILFPFQMIWIPILFSVTNFVL